MDIVCAKCGSINDYHIIRKSNNEVAYCNGCQAYIKNIPHDKPKLYVGKYKGIPIDEIEDIPYLKWALGTLQLTTNIKMAIQSRITTFEHLAR